MPRHMERELNSLRKKTQELGSIIEKRVEDAVESIMKKDTELAKRIIDMDTEIDQKEVEVEEECLKILALHQPVAIDLRFIVAVLKLNNDLERIGDLAVNLAERAIVLAEYSDEAISFDFPGMAQKVKAMLKNTLKALMDMDVKLAYHVCASDDEVDDMHRQMYVTIKDRISNNVALTDFYTCQLSTSRCLERIADHATNICEDIIYMIEGNIVRHRGNIFG